MVSEVIDNRSQFILFKLEGLVIKNKSSLQVRDFQATQYSIQIPFTWTRYFKNLWWQGELNECDAMNVNADPRILMYKRNHIDDHRIYQSYMSKKPKISFCEFCVFMRFEFYNQRSKTVHSRSLISRLFLGRWCYVSFYAESWHTYWLKYSENGMNWPRLDQSC